jgi:hypothetical protein
VGTAVTCTNDGCETRTCNGTAQCTQTPKVPACRAAPNVTSILPGLVASTCNPGGHPAALGTSCDDTNPCTYGDKCDGKGSCAGTPITCASDSCETRACNGTAKCTETPKACKAGGLPGMCSNGTCNPFQMTATDATGKHLAIPKTVPVPVVTKAPVATPPPPAPAR